MRSSGTTVVGHAFMNDRMIRNAPSGANYSIEIHEVTLDGTGAGTLVTAMDKPLGILVGASGATASATLPSANLANKTVNADDDELYDVTIAGTASLTYFIWLYGFYEGS
jgi:hypothetical protein